MRVSLQELTEHSRFFAKHGQVLQYKKGQAVSQPRDADPWVYYIESGVVAVSFGFQDSPERLIGFFVTDMIFSQSGVFYNAENGFVSFTTMTPSRLRRIDKTTYLAEVNKKGTLHDEFMQCILHNQSFLLDRIVYQAEPNVDKKLLRWVLFMLKYYGPLKDNEPATIGLRITQETIANFLHVSREAVNKSLMRYIKQGALSINKKRITVEDMAAIKAELHE